jgi:hypothetical protein
MIQDMFIHRCSVYRLQGFTGYDATLSEEGEIIEAWGITALNAACLFEPEDTAYQRRSDGVVDIGGHKVFLETGTAIQNGDRIYWGNSEGGPAYYGVRAVMPKRDRFGYVHHIEVRLDHIDWYAPLTTVIWTPQDQVPNVVVKKTPFDYRDSTKVIADILLGYWLKSVSIQILVPFNDPTASLSVSDSAEVLVPSNIMDLTMAGNYNEITVSKQYSFNDNVTLSLDSRSSSQGSGIIFTQVIIN